MKIPLLVGMALSAASLVTLGTFTVKSSFLDNSKISEQEKWRDQFYREKLYDKDYMCESPDIQECSKEANKDKEYLPAPDEDGLWQKAYLGYKNEPYKHESNSYLKGINSSSDWKDYCYNEVKNAIDEFSKNGKKDYFNVDYHAPSTTNNKYHSRCVLSGSELEKIIKK